MGTTVTNKNGIEFDIDALATDVNGKADKDLSNANPSTSFINTIIGNINTMPDYSKKEPISAFPYTVPQNGYIYFGVGGSAYGGISVAGCTFQISGGSYGENAIIPVSVGDVVTTFGGDTGRYFIPCKQF